MALFESMLVLLLVAIVLLQVARRLAVPYPTMLALAGVTVASLPWAPSVTIDPDLALALFIAPALLDAAYDLPPRELRRNVRPLIALAGVAVVLTTVAVAWVGVAWGLPLAAAVALGAIVAPPDAAAATAMLGRFDLPRRTVTVLKGEGLLNDAVALLIFSAAVDAASSPEALSMLIPELALAVPGGLLLGVLAGKVYVWVWPRLAGTLGSTLFEFASTFGVWIMADRLHLSAILAVVAFAMTVARYVPERQSPRERVHSYSVWGASVFLLNVLAFLLMGLQARSIVASFDPAQLGQALGFAALVLAVVVAVRVAWVLLYNRGNYVLAKGRGVSGQPTVKQGLIVAWCGMRGIVTLAAALALPASFPERNLIVLGAFAVVLGTLIGQGLTLGPLIRLLRFGPDPSFEVELSSARLAMLDAALERLGDREDAAAMRLRAEYQDERVQPVHKDHLGQLRLEGLLAQRCKLNKLRGAGEIDDDVFHALELELDWAELAASPQNRLELVET